MADTLRLRGERVKQARRHKGFSQDALAKDIGVSQSNLSFIEGNRHNTNLETLDLLIDKLGVTKEWLTGDSMEGGVPMDDSPSIKQVERDEISKRFLDAYERLRTLNIIETDAEFADFANIPRSTLSLALAGKNPVSLEWVPYLEEKGANRDYIYNNLLPILKTNRTYRIKDTDDLAKKVISLMLTIEEDMKLLKTYLGQIL